jgi:hypothetical protein
MRQKYFTKYIVNNNALNLFSMKSDCFLRFLNTQIDFYQIVSVECQYILSPF